MKVEKYSKKLKKYIKPSLSSKRIGLVLSRNKFKEEALIDLFAATHYLTSY